VGTSLPPGSGFLQPVDDQHTRLIVRQRCTYSPNHAVLWHIVEPLNFVMERKMLLGLKVRAETAAHVEAASQPERKAT
jgi:hypothetical protein